MELSPIPAPENGDLYTLQEFIDMVMDGSITNYDGTGYYAYEEGMNRDDEAIPSEIRDGFAKMFYTHVVWFNK